ncbi:MAG: hypothetical protein WC809_03840 [Sinimarinibacterium sp.]|jgi:hypothetical protein
MAQAASSVIPMGGVPEFDAFCRQLCAELGEGFHAQNPGDDPDELHIWTPERGCLSVHRSGRELLVRAIGWPNVAQFGLKRSFRTEISARIAITRDAGAAARDLQRRVIGPYRAALADARSAESGWRNVLKDVSDCLDRSALRAEDVHAVGRNLQARRPLGALDESWAFVPSQCTNTIHLQDQGALGSFEAHYLSLAELAELNRFVDALVAKRRPKLRLRA